MREALDAAGLAACSAHVPLERFERARPVRGGRGARRRSCSWCRRCPSPADAAAADAVVERLVAASARTRTPASASPTTTTPSSSVAHGLWERIVASGIDLEPDVGWLRVAGRDPVAVLGELKAAARSCTPRTSAATATAGATSPAGEGELDWPAIAAAARRRREPADRRARQPLARIRLDDIARSLATLRDAMSSVGVGVVGCGTISGVYLDNAPRLDGVRLVACADADPSGRPRCAAEHGLDACEIDELLARDDVEVVLCLTPPDWHAEIGRCRRSPPAATSTPRSRWPRASPTRGELLDAAAAAGVLVGCAPDTFLGAGIQTLRRRSTRARIGTPAVADDPAAARPARALASLPRVPVRRALRAAARRRALHGQRRRSSSSGPSGA